MVMLWPSLEMNHSFGKFKKFTPSSFELKLGILQYTVLILMINGLHGLP